MGTADLSQWEHVFDAPTEAGENDGHQYYNAHVADTSFYSVEQGGLVLRAMRSSATSGFAYAAPWLQGKRTFGIGTYTIVATIPKGIGLWPAMWMVPQSQHDGVIPCRYSDSRGHCSWPTIGEIDIFETVNGVDSKNAYVWQTLHMGKLGSGTDESISQLPKPGSNQWPVATAMGGGLDNAWWSKPHTFSFVRHNGYLQWSIDGQITQTITQSQVQGFLDSVHNRPSSYGSISMAPFDDSNAFNIILNIAVGGMWPCSKVSCGSGGRSDPIPDCPVNDAPADMIIHSLTFQPH